MKLCFTLFFALGISLPGLLAQGSVLTGTVTDANTGEPMAGANVLVLNTNEGTFTDENGGYELILTGGDTYEIVVSYTGYGTVTETMTLAPDERREFDVQLSPGTSFDEVVVSSSRRREKLVESPATIETFFAEDLRTFAGNPGELLARQKGIDYIRAGVATPGINIRGFNSNFNAKNLQVTDGRYSTLIATGLPFGPLNTTIKEDIERVEVVLGPNSTMYGPNAHNGLLNTITKDPRTSAGTTVALTAGNQSTLSMRFRHAQVLSDKFAFKISGEYAQAEEFEYIDSVYIDRLDENGNPGMDGQPEAYRELDLDRDVRFVRTEAALYYSPTNRTDIIFNYGRSNSNYLAPTNVGRNQIQDWNINYYQVRLTHPNWYVQANLTTSRTDSTYSIDERTKQYWRGIDAGVEDPRGAWSYQSGALFQDRSRRWSAEAQYNNTFGNLELITGVQYFLDQANSLGTYLLDENEDDFITVNQLGGYAHLRYYFGRSGFSVLAAARADWHEIYDFNFVPKFGLLWNRNNHNLRLTYGQGIAAPTILNMFGNLFNGLILGNAEGFTLADGSMVERQSVERLQTIEAGYRGQVIKNKLFIDANAYYNFSKDFLSPLQVLGVATERGDTPIEEVQDGFPVLGGLVASYINFGQFDTYGADISVTYYFTPEFSATGIYSYFDTNIDTDNVEENDFNGDGEVNFLDVLVNAPTHKASLNLAYRGKRFFGNFFTRWVQSYNYFSSFQIASETLVRDDGTPFLYRGVPIVENARSADAFNYGPLGGFVTFDLSAGVKVQSWLTASFNVTNLFNTEMREFTAAPPTGRLFSVELRFDIPAIAPKKR